MRHFKLLSIVVFVCALAETWCIRSEEKLLNRLQCAALQGAVSALVEHEVTIPMGTNLSNHYCYGEGKAIPGYKVDFKHQHVNKLVVHKNNADACSDSMRGLLRIFAEYDPNKVKCSFEQQKREFRIGFNPASNKEMCFECFCPSSKKVQPTQGVALIFGGQGESDIVSAILDVTGNNIKNNKNTVTKTKKMPKYKTQFNNEKEEVSNFMSNKSTAYKSECNNEKANIECAKEVGRNAASHSPNLCHVYAY